MTLWSRLPHVRRVAVCGIVLAMMAGASLGLLVALPYSTSDISSVPPQDALQPPSPDFHVGPLEWSVSRLSRSYELEPFRQLFRATCGGRIGIDAAICVSEAMARAFPNGRAPTDFVDGRFDPVSHMRAHLAGTPGHCMNRTAILAAELLAEGIPARVVQILSPERLGHTVVEVWSDAGGWTVVDPTFDIVLHSRAGAPTAWALVHSTDSVRWARVGRPPAGQGPPLPRETWRGGTVIYPEPWLYLRVGRHSARWPYRGRYVTVRPSNFLIGPAQRILGLAFLTAALSAAGCLAYALLAPRTAKAAGQASA